MSQKEADDKLEARIRLRPDQAGYREVLFLLRRVDELRHRIPLAIDVGAWLADNARLKRHDWIAALDAPYIPPL
jgi:hypothetical protein